MTQQLPPIPEELRQNAHLLIVAADFKPEEEALGKLITKGPERDKKAFRKARNAIVATIREKLMTLAQSLAGTGVTIKINSVLRLLGYQVIEELQDMGLRVFADMKLNDIPHTMKLDAQMLSLYEPEMVTVMCNAGPAGLAAVEGAFEHMDDTEIVGVTVLTSMDDVLCQTIFGATVDAKVLELANMAELAQLDGIVCSPQEAALILEHNSSFIPDLNCPNVRPDWYQQADDQEASRKATPKEAILLGADHIIVGRPITLAEPNEDGKPQSPREAVIATLEEMAQGFIEKDEQSA